MRRRREVSLVASHVAEIAVERGSCRRTRLLSRFLFFFLFFFVFLLLGRIFFFRSLGRFRQGVHFPLVSD